MVSNYSSSTVWPALQAGGSNNPADTKPDLAWPKIKVPVEGGAEGGACSFLPRSRLSQQEKQRGWVRMKNLSAVKISIQARPRLPRTLALVSKYF